MTSWLTRLRARIKHRHFDRDLREELSFHQAMAEHDCKRRGVPPGDARRQAHRALGNTTLARERARSVWIPDRLERLWRDVAHAVRSLIRRPSFTLPALLTLVVAIGINASLFTVFSAAFLRPWPVPHPGRVFVASLPPGNSTASNAGAQPIDPYYADFVYMSQHATESDLVAYEYSGLRVRLGAGVDDGVLQAYHVSDNFFDVLGFPMERGTGFHAAAAGQSGPTAVISDGLWRGMLGSDPNVIGRVLHLDDVSVPIVGVLSPDVAGIPPRQIDVYVPLSSVRAWNDSSLTAIIETPTEEAVSVAGRLRQGASRATAQQELTVLHHQAAVSKYSNARDVALSGTTMAQAGAIRSGVSALFALMFAACLLVLALACANVGNLQLARSLSRHREITIRLSLGASRGRVIRQLLIESLTLSCTAGLLGVGVAFLLTPAIMQFDPAPTSIRWTPDLPVLAFSLALAVVASIVFGLAPALRVTRAVSFSTSMLKGRTFSLGGGRTRSLILGAQIAISMVLLIGATLLVRGLVRATTTNLGFSARDVAAGPLSAPGYDAAHLQQDGQSFMDAVRASGLGPAAFSMTVPLGAVPRTDVRAIDRPDLPARRTCLSQTSSAYFDVLRIPFVRGRTFSDDPGRKEVVVNQAFARIYWPDGRALGRQIVIDRDTYSIVGIVKNAHTMNLDQDDPIVHRAYAGARILLIRQAPDLAARLQAIAAHVDPHLTVTIDPLANRVRKSVTNSIIGASIASGLGVLALALATVGVFGVFGCLVEERRREIGIRIALGARGPQVIRMILATTKWATLGGLAIGLLLAAAASFVLRGYLFGLSPVDPLSYAVVSIILGGSAALATYLPAKRAARVDPAVTLRCD